MKRVVILIEVEIPEGFEAARARFDRNAPPQAIREVAKHAAQKYISAVMDMQKTPTLGGKS